MKYITFASCCAYVLSSCLGLQEVQQLCSEWKPEPLVEARTAMPIEAPTIVR